MKKYVLQLWQAKKYKGETKMANQFYQVNKDPKFSNDEMKESNVVLYSILKELRATSGDVKKIQNSNVSSWIKQIKDGSIIKTWPSMAYSMKKLQELFKLLEKSPENRMTFVYSSVLINSLNLFNRGYVDKSDSVLDWDNYTPNDESNTRPPIMSAWQCVNADENEPVGLNFHKILGLLVQETSNNNYKIVQTISDSSKKELKDATKEQLKRMHSNISFNQIYTNPEKDPIENE